MLNVFSQQQNMEIHLKIKRSKKELEALENQEKEVSENKCAGENMLKRVSAFFGRLLKVECVFDS